MTRWLAILFLLPLLVARAGNPLTNTARLSFETGSHWQHVDTTSLLSASEGALWSSWSLSATGATNYFKYSTDSEWNLPNRYSVAGVATNATDSGTRGLAVLNNTGTRYYITATLGSTLDNFAFGFAIVNNLRTVDFGNWDLMLLQNGSDYAVVQYRTYDPLAYRTHSSHADSTGNIVPVGSSSRHWITGKYDRSGTTFTFSVYDLDTHAQISTNSSMNLQNVGINSVTFDNNGHGVVQNATNHIDNFVLSTNINDFPILPWLTNVYYVDATNGNNSNSGRTAAQAWQTITKAEATISAGETAFIAAGTYDEAVTFDADGATNSPRRFIGGTNVVCRNFIVTGDFIQLSGFEFTAINANTNVTPIVVNDCGNVDILDNYFHDTGHGTSGGEGGGVRYGNATNLVIRGNTFLRCGVNGSTGTASNAKDIADYYNKADSYNVLIEYNRHSHAAEYMNLSGSRTIARNIVFGPTDGTDWSGTPHIDGLQLNALFRDGVLANCWHNDNTNTDAHFYLAQYGYSADMRITGNVIRKVGDPQAIWIGLSAGTTSNHFVAHNTIGNSRAYEGTPSTAEPIYFNTTTNNWAGNNIFTNVTTATTPYDLATDGYVNKLGADIMYSQGTSNELLNVSNPLFVDYAGDDMRIQTTSPAKDAAVRLTGTTASGSSSTSVAVTNSQWFHDGFGLTRGDYIYVGSNNDVLVTGVNRSTHTLTVSAAISWSAGDAVGYSYRGSGPDIGAYEYGDTLLTSATISSNTTTPFPVYTVTPTGDARFVQFFADGIPQAPDYDSPYTYTVTAGEAVTAKAFALRAQATNEFLAAAGVAAAEAHTLNIGTLRIVKP